MNREERKQDVTEDDIENDENDQLLDHNTNGLEHREDRGPLTKEEIDEAYKVINDKYPLNFLSVFEVLSLHKIFSCWSKPKENKLASNKLRQEILNKALLTKQKKDLEQAESISRTESQDDNEAIIEAKIKNDKMLKNDPLNLLGLGIVAQFNLMKLLIFIFTVFSLLSIPIMILYSSGYDAMRGRPGAFAKTTLGNFGFTSSTCYSVTKELDTVILFCNTGVLTPEPGSFGIVPYDAANKNVCINGVGESAA